MSFSISLGAFLPPGVASLLGGLSLAGQAPAVYLGGYPFTDFAIPDRIATGAQQSLTVHKMPGGQRVIDNTGADPVPVTWRGTFLGPQAEAEAAAVSAMREAGKPVDLMWGEYALTVVIERFTFASMFHRADYDISLVVLPDPPPDDDDSNVYSEASAAGQSAPPLGTGQPADTPAAAASKGQTTLQRARTVLPVPPVPPSAPLFQDAGSSPTSEALA